MLGSADVKNVFLTARFAFTQARALRAGLSESGAANKQAVRRFAPGGGFFGFDLSKAPGGAPVADYIIAVYRPRKGCAAKLPG